MRTVRMRQRELVVKLMHEFDIILCVVNSGHGTKVLKIAKSHGVKGGTIFLGTGLVHNRLLEILDLGDIRREIVLMVTQHEIAREVAEELDREMVFRKPNHGIVFTIPITSLHGTKILGDNDNIGDRAVTDTVYSAIFTVVDRGVGEDVVDASKAAGARGATIIHARGSGVHETEMIFAMQIEPEKDVVLILAKNDICEGIISTIRDKLHIDEPGTGIIFTVGVNNAYGLSDA